MRVNERGTERFKDKNVSVAIVERTAGSAARCFTQLVAPPLLLLPLLLLLLLLSRGYVAYASA